MEYKAFTEGVRPGSVTTSHEVMILICYLIDRAGQPVSFQELNAALQSQELVNYFQFAETMESLRRSGHIRQEEYQGEQCYTLTPLGKGVSDTFEAGLPPAVRQRATEALERILTLVRRQRETGWRSARRRTGGSSPLPSRTLAATFFPSPSSCPHSRNAKRYAGVFSTTPCLPTRGCLRSLPGTPTR